MAYHFVMIIVFIDSLRLLRSTIAFDDYIKKLLKDAITIVYSIKLIALKEGQA